MKGHGIVISVSAIKQIIQLRGPSADMLALYTFYHYRALLAGRPEFSENQYETAAALFLGQGRTREARQQLHKLGLIEAIHSLDEQKSRAKEWLIRVNPNHERNIQ